MPMNWNCHVTSSCILCHIIVHTMSHHHTYKGTRTMPIKWNCTEALTYVCIYTYVCSRQRYTSRRWRHAFSKVFSTVPLYSKCTGTLTFQNFAVGTGALHPRRTGCWRGVFCILCHIIIHTMPHHHTYYVTSSYILCHIIIHTMSHHHTYYVTSSYILCHIIADTHKGCQSIPSSELSHV